MSETPWPEEESQMDAEWLSRTRPKRKLRRDAGSSKKWAPDSLLDMMPAYVNVNDLDDLDGDFCGNALNQTVQDTDGARSSGAGCTDQRPEADAHMGSPSRSPDRCQEEMNEFEAETSSSGRAPEQRPPGNNHSQTRGARHHAASRPANPIADMHALTSKQIMDGALEHLEDKERRLAKRREQTDKAKRKADERCRNMPSKAQLREAALAGDEPHRHCSGCDRAFEKNDIRIRYPHVVPIRTVCESCIAKSEVLDKLGVSSPALTVIPTDSVPFAWFPDNPLVVAERQCPRCQSRHKESSDENGGDDVDMDTFGTTARFRLLLIENGSMRWVDGKMVHWTCKKCKENKEEVCDVSPTLRKCAQEGMWPVSAFIKEGSVNGELMLDETMVFVNTAYAVFLGRLRFAGCCSFERLHHMLRAVTQDSGRPDLKLSNRMRSLLVRSVTLCRDVQKQLRHAAKDELGLKLNSCMICSKLPDDINPHGLGGCCGLITDGTKKGASRQPDKSVPTSTSDNALEAALREGHRLVLPQSDLAFSEGLTLKAEEKKKAAAAAVRDEAAAQAATARAANPTEDADANAPALDGDATNRESAAGAATAGVGATDDSAARDMDANARSADNARREAGAADASEGVASAANDGQADGGAAADGQACASGDGCPLGERFHSCDSPNMTPGIDATKEDQKPRRTTCIGVCTHLFIFLAGVLVSAKNECYLLIQTLAEEIVFHESFHPIKISDPAWPEALRGLEYLFAYYDIACRRVPRAFFRVVKA
jgi:hypothetical protein